MIAMHVACPGTETGRGSRKRPRQREEGGRGRDRGRGATSLASQEAVSWQSSVRATCEMPIYSLANIASDRTTTARTPQWRLKLPLTSMLSRLCGSDSDCGSDSESGCDLSASATYADMTARTQKRMGRLLLWQLCLASTLDLTLPRSGY